MKEKVYKVFISVGSNIEPEKNIEQALLKLNRLIPIKKISTHYRTAPTGNQAQPDYINGVWQAETPLDPHILKADFLREIERILGRERDEDRNAPRTIDLDILLYDELVINETELVIPDPNLTNRDFLAIPLYELAPKLVIPGNNIPLSQLYEKFKKSSIAPLKEFTEKLRRSIRT